MVYGIHQILCRITIEVIIIYYSLFHKLRKLIGYLYFVKLCSGHMFALSIYFVFSELVGQFSLKIFRLELAILFFECIRLCMHFAHCFLEQVSKLS